MSAVVSVEVAQLISKYFGPRVMSMGAQALARPAAQGVAKQAPATRQFTDAELINLIFRPKAPVKGTQ